MKITWLGQGGFLLEKEKRTILLDPYLSNACEKCNPASFRRLPIEKRYLQLKPNVILLTHDHMDHTDMETLCHYLPGTGDTLVLAAENAWKRVRAFGGDNNYVCFRPGTRWIWDGISFLAVKAEHSDPTAIGIVVDDGSKKYYFTGDTLYNEAIFSSLSKDLYAVFLPINGKGNNMNAEDAAAFAARTSAKYSVPIHFGMFDEMDPTVFEAKNAIIPKAYESVFHKEEK